LECEVVDGTLLDESVADGTEVEGAVVHGSENEGAVVDRTAVVGDCITPYTHFPRQHHLCNQGWSFQSVVSVITEFHLKSKLLIQMG